jgi:hypothetical protein
MVPVDQKPLTNGTMSKGYDWVNATIDLGRMLSIEDRQLGEVPREPFMTNRFMTENPLEAIPSWSRNFLDCR